MKFGIWCVALILVAVPVLAAPSEFPDHLLPEDGPMSGALGRESATAPAALFGREFFIGSREMEKPVTRLLAYNQTGPFPPFMVALQILPNGVPGGSRIEQSVVGSATLRYRIAGARVAFGGNRAWNYDPRRVERIERCEAVVSSPMARRLSDVWDRVVFQTRQGAPNQFLPVAPDGTFWSFASDRGRGRLATGWTGYAQGNPARLGEITYALISICERNGDANAHWKLIERTMGRIR
jgi:hypothetical protein